MEFCTQCSEMAEAHDLEVRADGLEEGAAIGDLDPVALRAHVSGRGPREALGESVGRGRDRGARACDPEGPQIECTGPQIEGKRRTVSSIECSCSSAASFGSTSFIETFLLGRTANRQRRIH